ncbi:unnamed protein product [Symbiodinium sp. KB8]|nr:unnamed protein product [Symbiodinium sp. KB8]
MVAVAGVDVPADCGPGSTIAIGIPVTPKESTRQEAEANKSATGPLKVLQAALQYQQGSPVLDCTGHDAAVVAAVPVVKGEVLQLAEFFSGGFAGWSQASYIMHRHKVPIHVRWTIDNDPDCWDMQQCHGPDRCQVDSLTALDALGVDHADTFHLSADVNWGWWVRVFGRFPVQVLCVSSPCQPWSRSGGGSGLDSMDGLLLLRICDLATACAIPLVAIEQVEHFPHHPHYPAIVSAWQQCGYKLLWSTHANLREVLPCQRNRYLMLLGRTDAEGVHKHCLDQGCWAQVCMQSLALAKVPFSLPPTMRASCLLEPDVLEKYMDPWLVPTPRRAGMKPLSPVQYRVKSPGDCAGVFVAQYQFQHELPPRMLETQGLLGCLFNSPDGLRFFPGPEIATAHGVVLPLWLSHDARTQMRLLGNAIAVPHAAALLAQVCRALHLRCAPEMAQAVHWCLRQRIHSGNALLIPVKDAWVLCSRDQAPLVFEALRQHAPAQLTERSVPPTFNTVLLDCPETCEEMKLHVPPGMPISQLFAVIGSQCGQPCNPLPSCVPWDTTAEAILLPVASRPQLNCSGFVCGAGSQDGWCVVLTQKACYVLDGNSPRTWSQLLRVFHDMHEGPCDLSVYATTGQRLNDTSGFGTCIVALPEDEECAISSLLPLAPHVAELGVQRHGSLLTLCGAATAACDLLIGVPFHLLDALGWASIVAGLEDPSQPHFRVITWPLVNRPHMPVDLMHEQWRLWLLTAFLDQAADECSARSSIFVEVQLVAKVLWTGSLPSTLCLEVFSQWWRRASLACGLEAAHRVFSGPFPQEPESSLQAIAEQPGARVLRKSGALLITIHPSFSGGGVKEENNLLAKTRIAALFLDRGIGLPETTLLVDSLVPKLGTAACLKALAAGDTAAQWQQLHEAASSVGIVLPAGDNRTERAAKRLQRAVRRRRLDGPTRVKACDFRLAAGSWVGIDHQPVPILDSVSHDCAGALLLDAAEATGLDLDLLRNIGSEALCVVIPGHECPDPDSCDGRVSTPVIHRESGHHHLIAACYHNLGDTSVRPHVAHGSDVAVQGNTCCTFTMFQEDFSEADWRELAKTPVRAANDAFQTRGVRNAIHGPWGRAFKASGRPSQPQLCDQCSFLAKVPDSLLKSLMQQSGFNNVFVVPRTWDRQLLPGWAVIWLPGTRVEVEKQVSLLAEQHGLVKARNRYGVRVPSAVFDRLFRQLRPGQEVPLTVQVKSMYKAGPFPASAAASDIAEWVKSRAAPLPVIQAGGPPPRPADVPPAGPQSTDPWLEQDPWSQYKANREGQAASRPARATTTPKPADDQLVLRVHTTEARLAELEQSISDLRDGQAAAAKERVQDRQQAAQDVQMVRTELQGLSAGLQQQFQQNLEGLRQAQLQQEQQMSAGMAELKSLILACNDGSKQRRIDNEL